jgi:hypothetical protein
MPYLPANVLYSHAIRLNHGIVAICAKVGCGIPASPLVYLQSSRVESGKVRHHFPLLLFVTLLAQASPSPLCYWNSNGQVTIQGPGSSWFACNNTQ